MKKTVVTKPSRVVVTINLNIDPNTEVPGAGQLGKLLNSALRKDKRFKNRVRVGRVKTAEPVDYRDR